VKCIMSKDHTALNLLALVRRDAPKNSRIKLLGQARVQSSTLSTINNGEIYITKQDRDRRLCRNGNDWFLS
jgi:hypothetical protein